MVRSIRRAADRVGHGGVDRSSLREDHFPALARYGRQFSRAIGTIHQGKELVGGTK